MVAIGAEVGALPPRGSAVTITASTPRMSAIVVVARPSRSGTKSARTGSTFPSRRTQASRTLS